VVAVRADDNKVVAVGQDAKEMLGRTPGNIIATRPLKEGVIADYMVTQAMLSYFINKVVGKSRFIKPEVMVCIPSGVTQVERRAVLDATMAAGARTAYLIDEPLAAAIGAKIPIAQAAGHMIINIGGGSTECAVISLGGVVVSTSVRVAGNKIDEAIALYVRKKFNLLIGERTAEEIKITIGNAFIEEEKGRAKGGDTDTKMEVRGRDSVSGLPRTIEITEVQVNEAITPVLMEIVKGAKGVMEQTPPELASDIIDKGVVMSGGSSLLKNIDKLMTHTTGVPCHVAEDPLLCVVRGTGVAVENIELYKRSIIRR
jgi:rod shape-determining protein MreB